MALRCCLWLNDYMYNNVFMRKNKNTINLFRWNYILCIMIIIFFKTDFYTIIHKSLYDYKMYKLKNLTRLFLKTCKFKA